MKKIVYSSLIFFILPLSFVHAYTFNQNLRVGSTGQDVLELQKFLNLIPITLIASEGPGSPGNETIYFGEKTKNAVIRLQNLYAEQILYPNGLTAGTGFVGQSTREFLNESQIATSTQSSTSALDIEKLTTDLLTNATSTKPEPQYGFVVSPSSAKPGQRIYVGSERDIRDVKFSVGGTVMDSDCYTDYTCMIHVPDNAALGSMQVKADDSRFGVQTIEVISPSAQRPELDVKKISLSQENLITGKNFGANMTIHTPYGVFKTETKDNSFILEFPKNTSLATSTGFIFAENKSGLQSDILILPYEK